MDKEDSKDDGSKELEAIHRVVQSNAPWAYDFLAEKLPLPEQGASKKKRSLSDRLGIH